MKKRRDIVCGIGFAIFVVGGTVLLSYASNYVVNTVTKWKNERIKKAVAENQKATDTIIYNAGQYTK